MNSSLILIGPDEAQQMLGRALARVRLGRNWSQQALAVRAGVSVPTVSRLERGQGAGLDAFLKVAATLDVLEPLVRALEEVQAPATQARTLDELTRQLAPRRRGRGGKRSDP